VSVSIVEAVRALSKLGGDFRVELLGSFKRESSCVSGVLDVIAELPLSMSKL
jgi:hypothetical protein